MFSLMLDSFYLLHLFQMWYLRLRCIVKVHNQVISGRKFFGATVVVCSALFGTPRILYAQNFSDNIAWQHVQETATWQEGYCGKIRVDNTGITSSDWKIQVGQVAGQLAWYNTSEMNGPAFQSYGSYLFSSQSPIATNSSFVFEYCVDYIAYPGNGTGGVGYNHDNYDYNSVLEKSILFYEAQRSGKQPTNNRIPWRGDSALNDRGCHPTIGSIPQECDDLTGGWYEAGNNMKFNFPKAATTTFLTWGILEFEEGYLAAGQLELALDQIKWETDYMLKASAHVDQNFLWAQVGVPDIDFKWWGRSEDMTMQRDAFFIDATHPGSDLAGEYAAALSAAAIMFAKHEHNFPQYAGYSQILLKRARDSFAFAKNHQGFYHEANIPNAVEWYRSSSFHDELAWSAAWLFKATGDNSYLTDAHHFYSTAFCSYLLELSWDDKCPGLSVILAQLTEGVKQQKYMTAAEKFLNYWLPPEPGAENNHIEYTQGGLAFYGPWGSLAYTSNTSFAALLYRQFLAGHSGSNNESLQSKLLNFSRSQMNYILGDLGHSFVVGFGQNPPQRPHHPTSSCPADEIPCMKYCANNTDCTNASAPGPNPQVLNGALIGGPSDIYDTWSDDRLNYITNEVSVTYNAGFQGAIAGVIQAGLESQQ